MSSETRSLGYPWPACGDCPLHPGRRCVPENAAAAVDCPVTAAMGLWGWPCHGTMAEVAVSAPWVPPCLCADPHPKVDYEAAAWTCRRCGGRVEKRETAETAEPEPLCHAASRRDGSGLRPAVGARTGAENPPPVLNFLRLFGSFP